MPSANRSGWNLEPQVRDLGEAGPYFLPSPTSPRATYIVELRLALWGHGDGFTPAELERRKPTRHCPAQPLCSPGLTPPVQDQSRPNEHAHRCGTQGPPPNSRPGPRAIFLQGLEGPYLVVQHTDTTHPGGPMQMLEPTLPWSFSRSHCFNCRVGVGAQVATRRKNISQLHHQPAASCQHPALVPSEVPTFAEPFTVASRARLSLLPRSA